MAKVQWSKSLIATIVLLGAVVLLVGAFTIWNNNRTPNPLLETSESEVSEEAPIKDETEEVAETPDESAAPQADLATLSSIDIEPLAIKVFYTKGVSAFEYSIHRTSDETQYVEFSSPELVGTKCTDDKGLIVSIVKNPTSEEDKTTLSQTITVDGVTYGLSLAAKNCTKDAALLESYQSAFTNGFSRLTAL